MSFGPLEIGIILFIALLVFGPKRLPGLGKQLGTGMREFKDGITGKDGDDAAQEPAEPAAITPAPVVPAPPAQPAEPVPASTAEAPRAEDPAPSDG